MNEYFHIINLYRGDDEMPYLLFTVCVSIIVALFAVQNATSVALNFFVWSFESSLVMVILGSFLLGILVAGCYLLMVKARNYMQEKKLNEEIAKLQKENKVLEERVAMLMHNQKLHSEDAKTAAEPEIKATSAGQK